MKKSTQQMVLGGMKTKTYQTPVVLPLCETCATKLGRITKTNVVALLATLFIGSVCVAIPVFFVAGDLAFFVIWFGGAFVILSALFVVAASAHLARKRHNIPGLVSDTSPISFRFPDPNEVPWVQHRSRRIRDLAAKNYRLSGMSMYSAFPALFVRSGRTV
ncbi:MAG: hypothetical protein R3C49_25265 [Planctomycetaceae bacterium]